MSNEVEVYRGWSCRCSPGAKADALEERYEEVKRRLSLGSPELSARPIKDGDILEALVISFGTDFCAAVDGINTDQWSAVSVVGGGPDCKTPFRTYIQCDRVMDGLIECWWQWARRFGFPDERSDSLADFSVGGTQ